MPRVAFPGSRSSPQEKKQSAWVACRSACWNLPPKLFETLERWGVRTCEALAALPVLQLSERLGQEGVQLHEWARGASVRSMVLAESGICFEEEMELDDSVEELEPLAFLLGRLLDQLCARLTSAFAGFPRHSFAFRTRSFRQKRSANSKRSLPPKK